MAVKYKNSPSKNGPVQSDKVFFKIRNRVYFAKRTRKVFLCALAERFTTVHFLTERSVDIIHVAANGT